MTVHKNQGQYISSCEPLADYLINHDELRRRVSVAASAIVMGEEDRIWNDILMFTKLGALEESQVAIAELNTLKKG